MKTRNYKVLGMLAVPAAALAVAAVLFSMSLGSNKSAEATQPNPGLEFSLDAGNCSTAPDGNVACNVSENSVFAVSVSLDAIPGTYDALSVTLNYTGSVNPAGALGSANQSMGPEWDDCVFEVTANGTGPVPPPFNNAGCTTGVSLPSSGYTGIVFTASYDCKQGPGTLSILHGPADTSMIDGTGKTSTDNGPDVLKIDCKPAPPPPTSTPTSTPPPIPRMFKKPVLQNVFLTRQGLKIPPSRCNDSTNVALLNEQINQIPATLNPKGELQTVAAFEFEVRFDPKKVCVNLAPAAAWSANPAVICYVQDKDSSTLEGIARIGCVTIGKAPKTVGLALATISVRPQPELYHQMRPNQDNGNVVQILNQNCELADEQGHAIAIFSCEDADITFRYLEGDVDGPDCDVDLFDTQNVAFRWGVNKGSLLYSSFLDLEPSGQVKGDGDIDIKDIQFVFGRFGSLGIAQKGSTGPCRGNPDGSQTHPPQPPVNSKK